MSEVINWNEAMEQCGDDFEFLTEILQDLRDEVKGQIANITNGISVSAINADLIEIAQD